jgi:excisionase family DNA binding protein
MFPSQLGNRDLSIYRQDRRTTISLALFEGVSPLRAHASGVELQAQRHYRARRDGRLGRPGLVDRARVRALVRIQKSAGDRARRGGRLPPEKDSRRSRLTGPGWMFVSEAASELGVSRQAVHRLIADGRISAHQVGRGVVAVERASVEACKQSRRAAGRLAP